MNEKIIKFDRWWKKLKYSQGIFTTIRKWSPEKMDYYKNNIGKIFDVIVTEKRDGFKGFVSLQDYILLIFEFVDVRKAKLLFAQNMGSITNFSKELIDYDTKE